MSVNLAGMPGVTTSITPLGSIPANTVKGIICVQGETKRGEAGKNYLVGTWSDFLRQLGGLHPDSDFPLQCKQALESGSKLRVSRAFHYDNIDDATTIDGELATSELDSAPVMSVAAKAKAVISAWTGTGSILLVGATDLANPSQIIQLCSYNGTAGESIQDALLAIAAAINAGTGTHGYIAKSNTIDTLEVSAPLEYGSIANGFAANFTITNGTLSSSDTSFAGGVYVGGAGVYFKLNTWSGVSSNIKIVVPNLNGTGTVKIVDYTGTSGQTAQDALIAIKSDVSGDIASNGYTAILLQDSTILFVKNTLGAAGNGDMATVTITGGTILNASLKFANGVTEYPDLFSTWTAKAVGDGYNGTVITIKPSTNNKADYCDITVQLPDSDLPQEIKGLKRVLTNAELISLNKQLEGVSVSNLVDNTLPLGTTVLQSGEQDISLITDVDYTGSNVSKSGWHAFDDVVDSMRMFNIARPTHEAAMGLMLYLIGRKDMRGRTFTPKGLNIQGVNDFRDGTGMYSHTPLDSFLLDLWVGNLEITDPNNLAVKNYEINGGGFQCGNRSAADNAKGEWYSDSGNDFGKIKGANGMPLNLGSPGNAFQYDVLYEKGVNAIINDASFKIVNWGNRTTMLDTTSLLSKANIADLVIFISREVKKIARLMNFKPNDIQMFNELYRRVLPFIKDTLVAGRAIEGDASPTRGEGVWWHWLGDQHAKDLNDLKINVKSEVDAGKYRVRFAFKPIAANEYIGLDIAPADSVTILNVAQISNLNA